MRGFNEGYTKESDSVEEVADEGGTGLGKNIVNIRLEVMVKSG